MIFLSSCWGKQSYVLECFDCEETRGRDGGVVVRRCWGSVKFGRPRGENGLVIHTDYFRGRPGDGGCGDGGRGGSSTL